MPSTLVSATVTVAETSSLRDELRGGGVAVAVNAVTSVLSEKYGSSHVPQNGAPDLLAAVNAALENAAAADGLSVQVVVTNGETEGVDTTAIRTALDGLDNVTLLIFLIVNPELEKIDMDWLEDLDNAKPDQTNVIYPDEPIGTVFEDQVDAFLQNVGA